MLGTGLHRGGGAGAVLAATTVVLVIDGLEAVLRALDGIETAAEREALVRLLAEGPGAGIVTVFSTHRPAGVPAVVEASVATRLVLNQSDPVGAAVFGVRGAVGLPPGRAVQVPSGRRVQLAIPGAGLTARAGDAGPSGDGPPSVGVLPLDVRSEHVEGLLAIGSDRWTLPIGLGDLDLAPVAIDLRPGEHIVVVGGRGAGKTTLLAAIAAVVARMEPGVRVVATGSSLCRRLAGGTASVSEAELGGSCFELIGAGQPALLLVDDADAVPDAGIAELVAGRHPHLRVVATSRPEVKAVPGHWVRTAARSRLGVLLRPSPGTDADLWHTPLPRRLPAMPPGRGLLVKDGATELIQVMRP